MPSIASSEKRWVVWNASPHHYCHDSSLFFNLTMNFSPPADLNRDLLVFGQGDVVLAIKDHPKLSSIRLKDVFYYQTDKPRNIINLKLLQEDYPKLVLDKMKIDAIHGTGIVHVDDPDTVVLEVDDFDGIGPADGS